MEATFQRYARGLNAELIDTPNGTIVSGRAGGEWEHPWSLAVQHEESTQPGGEWRAYVLPGLVNGRDAHIGMPDDWPAKGDKARDVPLTDEPEPYLVLREWRDPIRSQGSSALLTGAIIAAAGEGYPPFFGTIGVKPVDRGGDISQPGAMSGYDPARTRELRGIDIVLSQPRTGSRLDVRLGEPLLDAQTQFLDTVFTNDYARSIGGRARLKAEAKFTEAQDQTIAATYGSLLEDGDQQFDEIKLATVWMVSPPNGAEEDEPDYSWEPWVEYFVCWNLKHATRVVPPAIKPQSLQLLVPLAAGVAQPVINSLLAFINDQNEEARAFLNGADARGRFWT